MEYVPYILMYVILCVWGGMVFEDFDSQEKARWPLLYIPLVSVVIACLVFMLVGYIFIELIIRVITFGAYGFDDLRRSGF